MKRTGKTPNKIPYPLFIIYIYICTFLILSSVAVVLLRVNRKLGRRGVVHRGYWWGTLRERDHCEYIGVGGRITLEWICKMFNGEGALDCIDQAEDWDMCRALMNAVMNLCVP
jgi:hypothetical protein